jgi:hypothetical protein
MIKGGYILPKCAPFNQKEAMCYQKECMTGDNLRPGVRFSSNPEGDGSVGRLVGLQPHSTDFGRYRKASLLSY